MKFLRKTYEVIQVLFVISVAVFFFGAFLKLVIEPLAPAITVLTVLFFTLLTFDKRLTAIMSVGGIALYAASWPAVHAWGIWPGMLVWTFGFSLWSMAIYKSLCSCLPMAKTVTT